ncbi:hypothetical protein F0562_004356 [Nyssa sinensis]|uniref:C2H2-type domain-containing protein n=1 Tax=Nyssa sinensis TaxID=561372 RepID=A0A5J5C205_9ASTE|nr:hypothetical protein F0562_004356 [Nyssa sinensis]
MEEDQEQKFVCKFCSKRFFTGKSLGGHMRGHLAIISAMKHEDHNDSNTDFEDGGPLKQEKLKNSDMGIEGDLHPSYGLRQNPRKSRRVSDSKQRTAKKENLCKECGKGFHTLRAVSGHMRCHSMKERGENLCKKCGKGFDSMRALFGHMRSHSKRFRVSNESVENHSDYDTEFLIRKKRSRTRGVRNNTESLDNNSMIFEFQSLNGNKVINKNDGGNLGCDGDETWEMKKPIEKLESCVSGSGNALFEENISKFAEFDSGFTSHVELEVSVDGFLEGDEFKKPKLDDESGIVLCDTEIEKGINFTEIELKCLMKEVVLDQADLELVKTNSTEKVRRRNLSTNSGPAKRSLTLTEHLEAMKTSHKTVLETLEKSIQTKLLSDIEANSKLECNENSLEQEVNVKNIELKKRKEYECPICFKVFASGQALGGHKRAHYVGFSESRAKETMSIKQELSSIFDLNHPVTLEKETNDDVELKLWWVGSDQ